MQNTNDMVGINPRSGSHAWELFLMKLRYKEGRLLSLSSNKPILLNDPAYAWVIYSGLVDIFAARLEGDEVVGPRRHLFRAGQGRAAFGVAARDKPFGLVMIGLNNLQILRIRQERLKELAQDPENADLIAALLDEWVTGLALVIPQSIPPREYLPLEPGRHYMLAPEVAANPKKGVVWSSVQSGSVILADRQDIPQIRSTEVWQPVTPGAWLRAVEAGDVHVIDTLHYLEIDPGWAHLERFYSLALDCITLNTAQSEATERERLQARIETDQRQVEQALTSIASALNPHQKAGMLGLDRRDPLLAACQLVGQTANIVIRPHPDAIAGRPQRDPLGNIVKASRIRTRRVALRGTWWQTNNGPLLAYIQVPKKEPAHPVALLPSPGGYTLHDPAQGKQTPVNDEAAGTLEPFAVSFYRPLPERSIGLADLLRFGLYNCRSDILLLFVMGGAGGILSTLIPAVTGAIFSTTIPTSDRLGLLLFALVLTSSAISTALFGMLRGIASLRIEGRMDSSIQAAVWDRLLSLPVRFFRDYTSGDLSSRAMGISQIRQAISGPVIGSILSGLFSVFNLALLFAYGGSLAWAACLLVLIAVVVTCVFGYLQVRHQRVLVNIQGQITGMVLQFINGITKFRVAGAEGRAFAVWSRHFTQQKTTAYRARTLQNGSSVFNAIYPVLTAMVIFSMIGFSGQSGLSTGAFVAFNAAFGQFLAAALQLSGAVISILAIIPIFESSRPILETPPEVTDTKTDPGQLTGTIEVNHAQFRYRPDMPLVLKDVSFSIAAGEFVALVGSSGSGKSTMLRLLLGFDAPESGAIFYDGQDLAGLDVQAVRRQCGVVLQNGKLLAGDIYHNIVGSAQLTIDDAWEAARMTGMEDDIRQMPMGMFTVVSEGGSTLSGGQRQRLLIARAIVHKPRILFFDEATSALDNRTQDIVSRSLENLNATRVVIAHRLSTIINADRILVFDTGQIVQVGTYNQLIRQRGVFAELARRQQI
jgi:NHLM bacteriocin system ABC transporter ATP-binding protein